jgi:hypothetical protein
MSGRWAKFADWVGRYRWPVGIVAIIAVFFVADGLLIVTAFSARNVGPEEDYYERALQHDGVRAAVERAELRGLRVAVRVGSAPLSEMPRPVDVTVTDGAGRPVSGLDGTLTAVRPSDVRLKNRAVLVSVPGRPGQYRLLLRVPVSGLWVFELDARQDGESYRVVLREDVRI